MALAATALAGLVVATVGMLAVRPHLGEAHVALVYVLVVLLGSGVGGRALGLLLAGIAFLCFDYFFLHPYGTLVIADPLDWLVLVTFLVTSVVAAQLLTRAQQRAEEARARADEVERLSVLGAETVNVARAEDALAAIAEVIRSTLNVGRCDVYVAGGATGQLEHVAAATELPQSSSSGESLHTPLHTPEANSLLEWALRSGQVAFERPDGTLGVAPGSRRRRATRSSAYRGTKCEMRARYPFRCRCIIG